MKHEPHIQRELAFPTVAAYGKKNQGVKRLQEWLSLAGFATAVDGDFGSATKEALQRFQAKHSQAPSGELTEVDWAKLISPMLAAIAAPPQHGFLPRLRAVAQQHAKLKGREVGSNNAGPWVRLYMRGAEGEDQFWCAGFISFLLRQAALDCADPLAEPWRGYHQVSCDAFAAYGKIKQRFLDQSAARILVNQSSDALSVAVFLLRKTAGDWTHIGLSLGAVSSDGSLRFDTVEGNTNDGGSRNGVEVAKRIRAGKSYDFIRLS